MAPAPLVRIDVNLTDAGVVFAFHDANVGWLVCRVAFPDVRARPRQQWIGGVILEPSLRNVWSEHTSSRQTLAQRPTAVVANAVLGHWAVENQLHRALDV